MVLVQGQYHFYIGIMSHLHCVKSEADCPVIMETLNEMGGKIIKQGGCNGRGFQLWFVCISKDFVGIIGIQVILFNMDTSSDSMASSAPSQFIEMDIRNIKKKIKRMNHYLRRIDIEGGHRLEKTNMDMAHLRKEFTRSISQTENSLTGMLADLEIKFEKLELKVVKLEAVAFTGSSSRHGEKAK